ncbi:MAG TPA: hypothetical protein V6D19_25590 [Stenomitos sp.]
MQNSSIVKSTLYDLNLNIIPSDLPKTLHKSTLKKIENAWKSGSIIDSYGVLWVRVDKLWIIWRTDQPTAKELYLQVSKGKYRRYIGGDQYLRGCEVIKFIYDRLSSTRLQQRDGLGLSKDIFDNILNDPDVQLIALNANLSIEQAKRKLRKERIKLFKITKDELTNSPLNRCEFSHISSVKSYPELSDQMWNGLIVNKDTHKIITDNDITNGHDLHDFCCDRNWSIDWYSVWKQRIDSFY